ncbi:hypothetical protein SDC9_68891 [bioreactor metagenome]|uniref:Uncharacterized protein n=1 Tax=bioreactor metagenome TaxID=1076179 RepID=A0A644Y1R0_9ZZZZ
MQKNEGRGGGWIRNLLFSIGVTRCSPQSNSGRVKLGVETRDYLTANLRESSRIAFSLRRRALLRLIQ